MRIDEYFISTATNYTKHGVGKMKMEKTLRNQEGFTFVEMMGVIVVMLIGIGVAVASVNSLMGSSKLSNCQSEITTIIMKTKQAFANSSSTAGLTNTVAESLGIFPDNIKSTKKNPWGGAYDLLPATDTTRFLLTVNDVPQAHCSGLALFQKGGFESIQINSATLDSDTATAVSAATACSKTENVIIYTILK